MEVTKVIKVDDIRKGDIFLKNNKEYKITSISNCLTKYKKLNFTAVNTKLNERIEDIFPANYELKMVNNCILLDDTFNNRTNHTTNDTTNCLLIELSDFDEYFNILYEIEYKYFLCDQLNQNKPNEQENINLLNEKINEKINELNNKIKNIFDTAINSNNLMPMKKNYHRYIHSENKSKWIKTNNKLKLYRHLLWNCNLISLWFCNGSHNNEFDKKSINECLGINYIDSIGYGLKRFIKSQIYLLDDANEIEYTNFCKQIFDFSNVSINKLQIIDALEGSKFTSNLCKNLKDCINSCPKTYLINGKNYIDIIELFDMFFSLNDRCVDIFACHDKNNYHELFLESTDELFIDLDI